MRKLLIYLTLSVTFNIYYSLSAQNFFQKPTEVVVNTDMNQYQVSSQRYLTDEGGNILMFVNVWGSVNTPGSHLVYEGIDIATLLSVVGGPSSGANLKRIRLFREFPDDDGKVIYELDLNDFYKTGNRDKFIEIKPNDTIIFPPKTISYILGYTGTMNTLLSIINLYFSINLDK